MSKASRYNAKLQERQRNSRDHLKAYFDAALEAVHQAQCQLEEPGYAEVVVYFVGRTSAETYRNLGFELENSGGDFFKGTFRLPRGTSC